MSKSSRLFFNPLEIKADSLRKDAVKRHIKSILSSYNGWYDPFCEAIQNALDSVEKRSKLESENYQPSIFRYNLSILLCQ